MIYENVYDFSIAQPAGFQATINFLTADGSQPFFDSTGCSITMTLHRQSDGVAEFNWTTANNRITLLNNATCMINVPANLLVPQHWILTVEQYPKQLYNHRIEVFDGSGISLVGFTGTFTLYQLPTG